MEKQNQNLKISIIDCSRMHKNWEIEGIMQLENPKTESADMASSE